LDGLSIFIFIFILTFLFSFNNVLENNFKQKSFDIIRNVYKGSLFEKKVYDKFDDELKVIQALSYYKDGQIESYRKSLIIWGDDKFVINNFTLALLRNNESNRIKTFNSFARLYPKINELKMGELYLKDIKISQKVLWKRVFNGSRKKFEPFSFIKNLFIEFLKSPFIYCMIMFIIYILFTKKIFVSLGQSINCIKCSKIIKNDLGYKFSKMCDECHQLFLIKDIVFLEAKIIKEKELNKKYRRKYLFNLLLSIIIPGLNLNFKERSKVFFIFGVCFYFLLGFYISNRIIFEKVYLTSPIFVHFIGFIALIFYLSINLYSLKGEFLYKKRMVYSHLQALMDLLH
jgi:hypothetical protein